MKLNEKELAQLERNYMLGLVDDNFYYANNGKSLEENYTEYRMKRSLENKKMRQKEMEEKALIERINKQISDTVQKAIEQALSNIEKGIIK